MIGADNIFSCADPKEHDQQNGLTISLKFFRQYRLPFLGLRLSNFAFVMRMWNTLHKTFVEAHTRMRKAAYVGQHFRADSPFEDVSKVIFDLDCGLSTDLPKLRDTLSTVYQLLAFKVFGDFIDFMNGSRLSLAFYNVYRSNNIHFAFDIDYTKSAPTVPRGYVPAVAIRNTMLLTLPHAPSQRFVPQRSFVFCFQDDYLEDMPLPPEGVEIGLRVTQHAYSATQKLRLFPHAPQSSCGVVAGVATPQHGAYTVAVWRVADEEAAAMRRQDPETAIFHMFQL